MEGPISLTVGRWLTRIWFTVEIGQFVEARAALADNALFWPFWICLSLVILLGGWVLDYWKKQTSKNLTMHLLNSRDPNSSGTSVHET